MQPNRVRRKDGALTPHHAPTDLVPLLISGGSDGTLTPPLPTPPDDHLTANLLSPDHAMPTQKAAKRAHFTSDKTKDISVPTITVEGGGTDPPPVSAGTDEIAQSSDHIFQPGWKCNRHCQCPVRILLDRITISCGNDAFTNSRALKHRLQERF